METASAATEYRPRSIHYLAICVLLTLLAAACGESDGTAADRLSGTQWEMTTVRDGSRMVPAEITTIATLVFAEGIARGFDGCNAYQSSYSVDGDSVLFGEMTQPGSACDPAYAGQGNTFITALGATSRFVLTSAGMELADSSGSTQLAFRPASQLPLTDVSWRAVWYGEGASPLEGTVISLAFRSDGTLGGITGCNDYFADYEVDGNQLMIGGIAHTEKACLDPDGVMEQESDYLEAIRRANGFATSLTGLELFDVDGNPVAEYRFGGRTRT